jgi:hypothetical protein
MRTQATRMLVLGVAFVVCSCGSDTSDPSSTQSGGSVGSGGESVTETGGSGNSATGGGGIANPTGGSAAGGAATGGIATGGSSTGGAPPEAFELQGTWLYLGPWDAVHTLEITNASMTYTDIAGEWSSNWTITEYDNALHHFQLAFESGTGTYYPTGENVSGTYDLGDQILTVQVAGGLASYPAMESPGSCLQGADRIVDCGIYMREM